MKRNKAILASASILFTLLAGCSPASLPSAELTVQDYEKINRSPVLDEQAIKQFQYDLYECGTDNEFCQGKVMYSFYDKAFLSEGFSQVQTAITYSSWAASMKNAEVNDGAMLVLAQKWAQALMGVYTCVGSVECTNWLVSEQGVSEAQITELKDIINKANS
ncbi:hypothetical protein MH171_000070 [Vibrio parahaemolyticus]|jgi:hypothetical protein|uniref:hypothetical protein n=3 Tax=Vibrio TaxID=662 RepID=UPI000E374A5D|nr:hypothetical protein [Vibrio parahaemolyticus]RDX38946.1 hypothetical protein DZA51_00490 [Vibrio campbellii]EGU9323391.1 hypothetical protein [Vibrio parahaemolyticus]EIW7860178.1 hypothetical protein [Vibrio parahaemolyticus]ELA7254637.1 hypothetical protein [Vibrio parahaemolyticus]EMF1837854.1 hypothetical protein [Vibrio parahaemolyticus]